MPGLDEILRGRGGAVDTLLEQCSEVVLVRGSDPQPIYMSPRAGSFLDLPPREAIRSWERLVTDHPANREAEARAQDALRTSTPAPTTLMQLRTPAGRIVWAEARMTPIPDPARPGGPALHLVVALTDVTRPRMMEDRLRRHARFDRGVASIARRLMRDGDVRDVLDWCLADLVSLTESSRGYVFEFDEGGRSMVNTHTWHAVGDDLQRDEIRRMSFDLVPWWMSQLRDGREILVADLADLPPEASQERALLEAQGVHSIVALGLRTEGRLIGYLALEDPRAAEEWPETHAEMLRVVADVFGEGIARSRVRVQLTAASRTAGILFEASPEPLVIVDRKGRVLEGNASFHRATGRPPGETRGASIREILGGEFRLDAYALPAGSDGAPRMLLTPRLRRPEEAPLAEDVGTFVAHLANDINNPLTAVMGNLDLASEAFDRLQARTPGARPEGLEDLRRLVATARGGAAAIGRATRALGVLSARAPRLAHPVPDLPGEGATGRVLGGRRRS